MTSPPSVRCRLRRIVAWSSPMTSPSPGTTTPSSRPSGRCPSPRSTLTVRASQRWLPVVFSTALKRPTRNRWSTSSPQGWSREPALRPPWRGTGRGAHHRRTDPPQTATNVRVRVLPTKASCPEWRTSTWTTVSQDLKDLTGHPRRRGPSGRTAAASSTARSWLHCTGARHQSDDRDPAERGEAVPDSAVDHAARRPAAGVVGADPDPGLPGRRRSDPEGAHRPAGPARGPAAAGMDRRGHRDDRAPAGFPGRLRLRRLLPPYGRRGPRRLPTPDRPGGGRVGAPHGHLSRHPPDRDDARDLT